MNKQVMFSSNKDDWETPDDLFQNLDKFYHFTLDVCASEENAKVRPFFTKAQDGLAQSWEGQTCWCNPPYGKEIASWLAKALDEAIHHAVTTVVLLPARTDTKWFHRYYHHPRVLINFLPGRLRFKGAPAPAPFPSMLMVFKGVL